MRARKRWPAQKFTIHTALCIKTFDVIHITHSICLPNSLHTAFPICNIVLTLFICRWSPCIQPPKPLLEQKKNSYIITTHKLTHNEQLIKLILTKKFVNLYIQHLTLKFFLKSREQNYATTSQSESDFFFKYLLYDKNDGTILSRNKLKTKKNKMQRTLVDKWI